MPPRPIATLSLVLAMAVVQAVPLPAGAAPAAKPESPRAFLARVYEPYTRPFTEELYRRLPGLISPGLRALLEKSSEGSAARHEVPPLNGDYLVDAQEWKLERLRIEARPSGKDRAVGTVRFRSYDRDRTITLELVRVDSAWRIDDLVYEEGRRLSAFLKQAIAEEQARQPSPP